MGRYVFKLPDVGEGTAEAEIVAWHVKVGDMVAEDQILADIMTDKATVELTSPVAGTVIAAPRRARAQWPPSARRWWCSRSRARAMRSPPRPPPAPRQGRTRRRRPPEAPTSRGAEPGRRPGARRHAAGNYVFKLPDVGEGTAEAELVAWHVRSATRSPRTSSLAEIMTDKATVELTSPVAGNGRRPARRSRPAASPSAARWSASRSRARAMSRPRAPRPRRPRAATAPVGQGGSRRRPPSRRLPDARAGPRPGRAAEAFATRAAAPAPARLAGRAQARPRPGHRAAVRARLRPRRPHRATTTSTPTSPPAAAASAPGSSAAARPMRRPRARPRTPHHRPAPQDRGEDGRERQRRIPHITYVEEIDVTALEELRAHLNATKRSRPAQAERPALHRPRHRRGPARPAADQRAATTTRPAS